MKPLLKMPLNRFSFIQFVSFLLGLTFLSQACQFEGDKEEKVAPELSQLQSGEIRPQVGDRAPDFRLSDVNAEAFQLSQFRGKLVFLNFWATWCPPCIYEIPSMERLNRRFRTRGFQMMAVSVDDNIPIIQDFLGRLRPAPSFLILHDPGRLVTESYYGTEKYPETYLIGPNGELLKKYEGAIEWTDPAVVAEIEAFLDQFSL